MKTNVIIFIFLQCILLAGCLAPNAQRDIHNVQNPDGKTMTVGEVQRDIHVGMSGADVVTVLGTPNIVTSDTCGQSQPKDEPPKNKKCEVWVYDKVSSQQAYSERSGGFFAFFFSGGQSGAKSSVQKTLTIVIKFDGDKKVRDFNYRSSQF